MKILRQTENTLIWKDEMVVADATNFVKSVKRVKWQRKH